MKRTLILLSFLLYILANVNIWALEEFCPTDSQQYTQTSEISLLTDTEQIEKEEGISLFWAIFLNILPGFGVGSFLQGNILTGVIQLGVDGVPFAYCLYRTVDIMKDWHPALYIFFPFITVYPMLADVWPLFTMMAGHVFGVIAAVFTHRATKPKETESSNLTFALIPKGCMISYSY